MVAGATTLTRSAALVLAVCLSVASGTAGADGGWRERLAREHPAWPDASTLSGAYLSGSIALSQNDIGAAAHYMAQAVARDPGDPRLVNAAFQLTLRAGDAGEALELSERMLELRPADPTANLLAAAADIRTGDYATASARLDAVEDRSIRSFVAPMMEAWIQAGRGEVEQAAATLATLADSSGIAGLVRMHEGMIRDHAGDLEGARLAYERALEPQNSLRLVLALGSVYERLGQSVQAAELYRTYQERNPGSILIEPALARLDGGDRATPIADGIADGVAEVLFQMASALHGQNATDHALVYARLAEFLRPDFALGQVLVGDLLSDFEDYPGAMQMYRTVDEAAPEAWSARLKLARVLQLQERYDPALAILNELAAERPERAEPLISVGDIHRSTRRFDAAVVAYDDAGDRSPELVDGDWTFFYRRGIALERASQWGRAETDLQQAMALNPDHAHLLNYLGYSWVDRGENLAEAEALIRRAVQLQPDDGFIVDSLGWFYFRVGQLDRAVVVLEQAIELEPEDPVINDHLGDAYWMVGRELEARFQWRRALRTLEDDPELARTIRTKLVDGLIDPPFVDRQSAAAREAAEPAGGEPAAQGDGAGGRDVFSPSGAGAPL